MGDPHARESNHVSGEKPRVVQAGHDGHSERIGGVPDHAIRERIAGALAAVGPGLREILERVCLMGSALEAAERSLKLPRRAGKTVLKLALQRLARHYRMV